MRVLSSLEEMSLQVRAALPRDAHALSTLCAAHASYERLPYCASGHSERLHDALIHGLLHCWLLVQHDEALGYASLTLDFATLGASRFAHLDCLYLEPVARGQGGGHMLMLAVQSFAKEQGCKELQWQTPEWNNGAIRFYQRFGADVAGKRRFVLPLG
jgi:GNAT superfamily N-acetyltransferase